MSKGTPARESKEQHCHAPKTGGGPDFSYTTGNPIIARSNTKASNSCIKHKPHLGVQVLENTLLLESWQGTMTGPAPRESHSLMADQCDIPTCISISMATSLKGTLTFFTTADSHLFYST